ncbi:sigma-70 family RNA polymerase sigma factor [Nonomuraea phyllanthi]|uniref:RNA polymerase sigma factor SigJ n=1 Tax=Nonomuraea phyllanthi TaxID=2219224 RepID=UPI0012931EBE|nr:RNA polymerase sigma factor SigJ [Nonomuraea phyllanthi]QFY13526.1 sigma-70 family RNA polymerase sigma factor [Nonomuraea phyllanthi]
MTVATADRGLLMGLAYRLLGSVQEAEDAVQEAYTRWYALPDRRRAEIGSPTGWFVTVVSRICLDVLGSARARRERYVGQWLPEPVPDSARWTSQTVHDSAADPAERVSLDESISMALLVVLESMTPAERVAFILHDVFAYTFPEIGEIVGRSPQACRQLASSARRRVRERGHDRVPPEEHAHIVAAFRSAWESGDLTALVELLDPDATGVTDGGGAVSAAVNPIEGAERIAQFLLGVRRRQPDLAVRTAVVNGQAGLVARDAAGRTLAVVSVDVVRGLVRRVWAMRNPAKLTTWPPERPGQA